MTDKKHHTNGPMPDVTPEQKAGHPDGAARALDAHRKARKARGGHTNTGGDVVVPPPASKR